MASNAQQPAKQGKRDAAGNACTHRQHKTKSGSGCCDPAPFEARAVIQCQGSPCPPCGSAKRLSPHPPSLYIFKTPNGVMFPRPIFIGTCAVPRCPAGCPALSRAFPRPIFISTCTVPRCPAFSRAPFLPTHALSRAFPRRIFTSTCGVPRCPALSRMLFLPGMWLITSRSPWELRKGALKIAFWREVN